MFNISKNQLPGISWFFSELFNNTVVISTYECFHHKRPGKSVGDKGTYDPYVGATI